MKKLGMLFLMCSCNGEYTTSERVENDSEGGGLGGELVSGGASSGGETAAGSGGLDNGVGGSPGGAPGAGGYLHGTCGSGTCPYWQDDSNPTVGECVSDTVDGVYSDWLFVGVSFDINCGPGNMSVYCWETYGKYYGVRYESC